MAKKKTTALAKPAAQKTEIVKHIDPALPAYLQLAPGEAPIGIDNIERQDITLPRLALCQSMSPQRKRSDPKYIDGLQEGQWFNTVTRTNYGNKLTLVLLLHFKTRILFEDMDEGGGILCRSEDAHVGVGTPGGNCDKCKMKEFLDGEAPQCTLFQNYVSVVLSEAKAVPTINDMLVMSLKSTGLKAARDLNTMLKMQRRHIFSGLWDVSSSEQKNSKGTWYVPIIVPAGIVSEQQARNASELARGVTQMSNARALHVDSIEDLGDERESAAAKQDDTRSNTAEM